jgi:hypothetical protein
MKKVYGFSQERWYGLKRQGPLGVEFPAVLSSCDGPVSRTLSRTELCAELNGAAKARDPKFQPWEKDQIVELKLVTKAIL